MTKKRDRFFAAFGALLFLVTASFLTIAVIWSSISSKNSNKANTSDSSNTSSTDSSNSSTNTSSSSQKASTTKLQGTQLANFTPISKIDTLQVQDTTVGTGDTVKTGDTVTVDYTGALASTGVIFQSSLDTGQPVSFSLSQVIEGWQKGIPGMKVGGTRRLLIPAAEAYGAQAQDGIPANSDLVFDVTLHKIGS